MSKDANEITFYVSPASLPEHKDLCAIRSTLTRRLLAYRSDQGLFLLDRQSNIQHIITWQQLSAFAEDEINKSSKT